MKVQLNKQLIMEAFSPVEKAQAEQQARLAEIAKTAALEKLKAAESGYEQADNNYDTAQDAIPVELEPSDLYQAGALGALGVVGLGGLGYGYAKRGAMANRAKTYAAGTRPFRYAADVVKNYGQPVPPVK